MGTTNNWNEKRRKNAALYNEFLAGSDVITPIEMEYSKHVYHLYVIRIKNRDKLSEFLKNKGIATVIHYPIPIHLQQAYSELGHKLGDFKFTDKYSSQIISLPMFPELTSDEIQYVSNSLLEFNDKNEKNSI